MSRGARIRDTALLLTGAWLVHELRYRFGYGADAAEAMQHQGHGYLEQLLPALIAATCAALLVGILAPVLRSGPKQRRRPPARSWIAFSLALLAVFCIQELVEGALAAGHPSGLDGLLAGGGWSAAPASLLIGLALVPVARFFDRVEVALATSPRRDALPRAPRSFAVPSGASARAPLPSPLAFGIARRPPPLG
jgi:hypothetical protein